MGRTNLLRSDPPQRRSSRRSAAPFDEAARFVIYTPEIPL